jgi:hypothetical protein
MGLVPFHETLSALHHVRTQKDGCLQTQKWPSPDLLASFFSLFLFLGVLGIEPRAMPQPFHLYFVCEAESHLCPVCANLPALPPELKALPPLHSRGPGLRKVPPLYLCLLFSLS